MDWFITKNHQLFKLSHCECFWVENTDKSRIFCNCENHDWNIGEYETKEQAEQVIKNIFDLLLNEEKWTSK